MNNLPDISYSISPTENPEFKYYLFYLPHPDVFKEKQTCRVQIKAKTEEEALKILNQYKAEYK